MRLFLGGSEGLALYEDEDVTLLHSERVNCAVRPSAGRVIAGTESGWILVWEGNGDAKVTAKDLGEGVHSLALAGGIQAGARIFAGSIPASGWVSKDGGDNWSELDSFRDAPGNGSWTAPWGTALTSAIAGHPKDPKTLYFGVEVGGLYRTRDSGKKWNDLELPVADVHAVQVAPARHERVYVTTSEGAFCSDDDKVVTWREMGTGLGYTMGLAGHPVEPDRVIISEAAGPPSTWDGRGGARCSIHLSTDAGKRFRTVAKGLKGGVQRRALVINPKVPSEVAFGTSNGEVHYSNDGGESFDLVASGLGDLKTVLFA